MTASDVNRDLNRRYLAGTDLLRTRPHNGEGLTHQFLDRKRERLQYEGRRKMPPDIHRREDWNKHAFMHEWMSMQMLLERRKTTKTDLLE